MGLKEFWNERYLSDDYAFGESPNEFLKSVLPSIQPGKILFPAEGEGRNAVFAATLGWDVYAFDVSEEGKRKADLLAQKNGVAINYIVQGMDESSYPTDSFDAIALIYAHFNQDVRSIFHQKLAQLLKPGGHIILESFSKEHLQYNRLNPAVGGPTDESLLYAIDEIKQDFSAFTALELVQKEIELQEGLYHVGKGSAIRFFGAKK
jgi:SAM-dependent methyltransferase